MPPLRRAPKENPQQDNASARGFKAIYDHFTPNWMRPPSVGIYGYLVGGETDKPSKRVRFSRIETRPHRATGAAEAARVVGLRVYKQALERQVQRHLDEPRTAERILDEAASEGSRLIAKRGCGRRYSRDCTVPLASVGGAGLEVGAKT